jgi:hypothetical protein
VKAAKKLTRVRKNLLRSSISPSYTAKAHDLRIECFEQTYAAIRKISYCTCEGEDRAGRSAQTECGVASNIRKITFNKKETSRVSWRL